MIGDSSELDAHCCQPIHDLSEDHGLLDLQLVYVAEEIGLSLIF